MKKFKYFPAVLMLIASFAILAIGIYAVAPTKNTLQGTITVNSANPEVLISAFFHNSDGTLDTDNAIMEKVPARHGVEIDLGDEMVFDTSKCNSQEDLADLDIKVTIRVENPGDTALGVYFSKTAMTAEATADDIAKEKMLTDSLGDDDYVKATMEGYKGLPAKSGEINGTVDTTITYSLLQYVTGDTNPTVNLGAEANKVYLNIENCNDELIEAVVVETSGSSVSKDMVDEALAGATGMVKVEIPEGVTEISANAFENNTSITNVVLPSSVTSIGDSAFSGCTNLTTVEIAEEVTGSSASPLSVVNLTDNSGTSTSVGAYAFYNCTSLTSIEIPEGVTSIGSNAFYGCDGLTSVIYETEGTGYEFKDGTLTITTALTTDRHPAWYTANLNPLTLNVVWADGVADATTIIPYSSFEGSKIKSIIIPQNVETIGYEAFSGCSGLTSIEIPQNVETIDNMAFSGCSGLTSIEIPANVTFIGLAAFTSCDSLTTITVKSGMDLDSASSLPTLSKTGYTFKGWYTTEDTSGTKVVQISADAYTEDVTYYAVWTEIAS